MNDVLRFLSSTLLWPGLIGGALLGWFYLWMGRKLSARLQGRQGPPFYQPFFDFVKLMGKKTVVPGGVNTAIFYGLPAAGLLSAIIALALIPVPGNPIQPFSGDLIVLLYLLEMPAICEVMAGYVSRSLYGQVGAAREAIMTLGYNLPFLAAVIALAIHAGSFNLHELASAPLSWVHLAAAVAFLIAIPARLKSNPFSIPNAEQEIVAGATTEYNGVPLAFFELAHGVELVALVSLFSVLFIPAISNLAGGLAVYLVVGVILVALVTVLAVATARLKMNQAFRFYWLWGALAAVAAFAAAFIR